MGAILLFTANNTTTSTLWVCAQCGGWGPGGGGEGCIVRFLGGGISPLCCRWRIFRWESTSQCNVLHVAASSGYTTVASAGIGRDPRASTACCTCSLHVLGKLSRHPSGMPTCWATIEWSCALTFLVGSTLAVACTAWTFLWGVQAPDEPHRYMKVPLSTTHYCSLASACHETRREPHMRVCPAHSCCWAVCAVCFVFG